MSSMSERTCVDYIEEFIKIPRLFTLLLDVSEILEEMRANCDPRS